MVSPFPISTHGVNPENATSYFKSPVITLLESTEDDAVDHISSHDILEAYCVLLARIKTIAAMLYTEECNSPALQYLKQNAKRITQCVRRDIRRAFIDPFSEASHNTSMPSYLGSLLELSEDKIKYAKELSQISQCALQLLSNIYYFPALFLVFTPTDLLELLDDVLAIAASPSVPTPNSSKTRAMAIWVLSNMRLSAAFLSQRKVQLCSAVRTILTSGDNYTCTSDGLTALHNIVVLNPSVFLEPSLETFPSVLALLNSSSSSIRSQAAHAMSGYTLALLTKSPPVDDNSRNVIKHHIHTFIDTSNKRTSRAPDLNTRLKDTLIDALHSKHIQSAGQGQPWALVVLACIIVLSDADIFTHPRTLRLVITSLDHSAHHKLPIVRDLHAFVWRCLVWAFARIRPTADPPEGDNYMAVEGVPDVRHVAFLIVKQERQGGVGLALVGCLLCPVDAGTPSRDRSDLYNALTVIKDMVQDPDDSIYLEGKMVLVKLISGIGSPPSPTGGITPANVDRCDRIIVTELFDGTVLKADEKRLETLLPLLGRIHVDDMRQLAEIEIVQHWDDLLNIWMICVRRTVEDMPSTPAVRSDLLHVWQALLLVQAQLTQEYGHLTTPPEFAHRISAVVTEILQLRASPTLQTARNTDLDRFLLTLVKQLWGVMKNVFQTSWLASTAGSVATVLLGQQYDLTCPDVKIPWGELCAALISSDSPDLLCKLVIKNERQNEVQLKRYLWYLLAKEWRSADPKPTWTDSASFLAVAFDLLPLSDEELSTWETILDFTIGCASSASITSSTAIETLTMHLAERCERLSTHPKIILALLSRFKLEEAEIFPNTFLSHINDFLCDIYDLRQELLYPAIDVLRTLTHILKICPKAYLVSVVSAISDGLCIWISDTKEILLEEEYNDIIINLYRDTLHSLRGVAITADILEALTPFLSSAFYRIPAPAFGPVAFKEFWELIRPIVRASNGPLPKDLKEILGPCYEFFGGTPPSEISADSESQSQSQSQSQFQSQSQEESFVPETPLAEEDANDSHCFPLVVPELYMDDSPFRRVYASWQDVQDASGSPNSTFPSASRSTRSSVVLPKNGLDSPEIPFPFPSRGSSEPHSQQVVDSPDGPVDDHSKNHGGLEKLSNLMHMEDVFSTRALSEGIPGPALNGSDMQAPLFLDRARSEALPDSSFSLLLPSSPTTGKRVFRVDARSGHGVEETGGRRLLKRRRLGAAALDENTRVSGRNSTPSDSGGREFSLAGHTSPIRSEAGPAHNVLEGIRDRSTSHSARSSNLRFDCVELPTYAEVKRKRSKQRSTTQARATLEVPLSLEIPLFTETVAARGQRALSPASDDYATWETGVDLEEVQQVQSELMSAEVEEDDQFLLDGELSSSQLAEDQLLTPSMRREAHIHRQHTSGPDETILPSSQDDADREEPTPLTQPAHAHLTHALHERSQTAPACSVSRAPQEIPIAPPLRRARTTSARLDELQRVRDALRADGSQMPVDEMLAAAKLVNEIDGVLKASLMRRLGQGHDRAEDEGRGRQG